MPRVVIDNHEVDVPAGSTLLAAARQLGLDIPTLCYHEDCQPNTTCMVCLVKVKNGNHSTGQLVPSCATPAEDGMCIESETDEVRQVRQAALELLLSNHACQCRAPCQYACPFGTDVAGMIRRIAANQVTEAGEVLRSSMPLAAVLSRLSPESCESGCRRRMVDQPVAIGLLKRYVADKSLPSPKRPSLALWALKDTAPSGKHVAIVGTGPAGLSAAYFLLRMGHACTLFDSHEKPGGTLRRLPGVDLPHDVLKAEIALIKKLGARFEMNTTIEQSPKRRRGTSSAQQRMLDDLRQDYDAVLTHRLKTGATRDVAAGPRTGRILPSILNSEFAILNSPLPRTGRSLVRDAAYGKAAAIRIDQFLRGIPVTGPRKLSALRTRRPLVENAADLMLDASPAGRVVLSDDAAGLTDEQARAEAQRCLHCDCRKLETCRLRKYAEMYEADGARYRGERRQFERLSPHPDIIYEPGKCIMCGLCVQIAEQAAEPLGLTLAGRGFNIRIAVPFDRPLSEALQVAALKCVEVCPTGALARRIQIDS